MWQKSDFTIAISMKNCTYTLVFYENLRGSPYPPQKKLWKLLDAKVLNVAKNGLEDRNQNAKLYLWGDFRENLRGSECDSECESESEDVLMDVLRDRFHWIRTLEMQRKKIKFNS